MTDPGFLRRGPPTPKGVREVIIFGHFFPEDYMKIKEIRPRGPTTLVPLPWIRQLLKVFVVGQQKPCFELLVTFSLGSKSSVDLLFAFFMTRLW